MKKIFLTCTFLISLVTFAQVKLSPGVKLGVNSSTITNYDSASNKIGINAGTFVNIDFSDLYELQVEANYSNQGFSGNGIAFYDIYYDPEVDDNKDVELHYVGLTLINKFFFIPDVGLHLMIGPSFDIKVADNIEHNDNIAPIDFALNGGIGYEFPFGLGIEARYKRGFINVNEGHTFDSNGNYYEENYKNSVFQLGVFYKINFGK